MSFETEKHRVFQIFDIVYALLENETPRRFDCGKLCSGKCCENLSDQSDAESGMMLLPYEKEYLESRHADFSYVQTQDGNDMLVCNGSCDRSLRPIACRLFPYYIKVFTDENDKVGFKIRPDLRGISVCPLIFSPYTKRMPPRFIRNVKRSAKLLCNENILAKDLQKNSDFVDSLYELYTKFGN